MIPVLPGLALCGLAATVALVAYTAPGGPAWWHRRGVFVLLLTAALGLGQWDAIRANFQIWNPDESQMIAGALTLQERPVFWRDVDGMTHGPLDQLPLLLPALVGARIDYTSARIVGALLTVLLLLCLHSFLAARHGEGAARLLVLPAWALFIFNQDPETAQYTSELMPSLLLLLGVALWPKALARGSNPGWCWAAGAACGAAPFAKLQVAPLAAWLGCFLLASAWSHADLPGLERRRRVGWLVWGAISPGLFLVGWAGVNGAFADFRVRYLESNLFGYAFGGGKSLNDALPTPGMINGFSQFLWPVTGAILAGGLATLAWRLRRPGRDFRFALGLVATALIAIYSPHKPFGHYFLLLVGPLVLLLGAVAGPVLVQFAGRLAPARRAVLAAVVLAGLTGFTVVHYCRYPYYFPTILRLRPRVSRELVESVQHQVAAGETLAVWGWQPALYVMTQTVSATPDLIIFWQIQPSRWLEFYQARYLRDLAARPPAVFVDTMGPADFFYFTHPAATRHENLPALQAFIARDYVLAETVAECRIYVRRDRARP